MPFGPTQFVSVNPSNPNAIASATLQTNGLGVAGASAWVLTPSGSGRIIVCVSGDLVADANARAITARIYYGTGTAPANGVNAAGGTATGATLTWTSLTSMLTIPFTLTTMITGLTLGTPVWIDVESAASAGTGQLTNLNCWAVEV